MSAVDFFAALNRQWLNVLLAWFPTFRSRNLTATSFSPIH